MALSSQMSRHDRPLGSWGSASHQRRRRSPARSLLLLVMAAGTLGAGGWGLWHFYAGSPAAASDSAGTGGDAGGPRDPLAAGSDMGLSAPLPSDSSPPPSRRVAADPPPPPLVLEMGRTAPPTALPTAPISAPEHFEQPQQPADAPQTVPTALETPPVVTVPPPAPSAGRLPPEIASWVAAAERARAENRLVEARTLLNRALVDARTTDADRAALRQGIADLNDTLVFSPAVIKGDPLTDTHTVQSGDSLAKITAKLGLGVDWRLVQRVNRLRDPSRINVGQKLKVVRGPFHAVVDKSDFRIDLYAGEPISASAAGTSSRADGIEPSWIYIRSFRVGLGEHGTTPIGTFIVRPSSKLVNPFWKNPRTGEEFAANNPLNPIGEHWMGLEGLDDATKQFQGYGVHGTIAPDSIGKEMSMGCVRLAAEDIAVVYEMLEEGVSIVRIVP